MADEQRGPRGWPPLRPPGVDDLARRGGAGARRGAPGGGPSSSAGAPFPPPSSSAQAIAFPPDYFPVEGATDFQLNGFAAGLVPGPETILDTFNLPPNDRGVIRSLVFGVNDYTAVGQVRFRVLIAGAAPAGWGNIIIPPQAAAFCAFSYGPDETRIWVPPGKQVQIGVTVLAGGPFGASGVLHGWHWQE